MSREDQGAKHVVEEEDEDELRYHGVYASRMHKDALDLYDQCKTPRERRDLIKGYYSVELNPTEARDRDDIRRYFEMWGYGDEEADEEESTPEENDGDDNNDADDDHDHCYGVRGGGESQLPFYESDPDLEC